MIDEIFDRSYQSGRLHLNRSLGHLLHDFGHTVSTGLAALNRMQFDAPWRRATKRNGRV